MKLVTRAQWGARAYKSTTPYARKPDGVKVHYLGTKYTYGAHDTCAAYVRKLQASHMDGNGWSDIGYSFVVCEHGYVYEGRGFTRRNSANGNTALNEKNYAVCGLVGNSGSTQPTPEMLHGIRDIIDRLRSEGRAGTYLGGHRDGYATDCPGGPLYQWVKAGAPRPGVVTTPPANEGDDVALSDADVQRIAHAVWEYMYPDPLNGDQPTAMEAFVRWNGAMTREQADRVISELKPE